MAKGRGFRRAQPDRSIQIESMVSGRNGNPLVRLKWGKESGMLTPDEARQHAFGILEAAASAEMDAVVVKWADQELGMGLEQAAYLRRLFRQKREAGQLPSITMNMDGERVTPNEARQFALDMIFIAFNSEMEAFLTHFLITEAGSDEEAANVVIEALREMRGLKRVDELIDEEGDRP